MTRSKTPSEVLEKGALHGKSIRQVIDEEHPEKSDDARSRLAKIVVAEVVLRMIEAGATPEQIRALVQ